MFFISISVVQEDVLSAGSTPAKPPVQQAPGNNYSTKLELPSQLPGLSATGGTGPPSPRGQLGGVGGGMGPPSPRGLTAPNPLNPAAGRPTTPQGASSSSQQQQPVWPSSSAASPVAAAPPNTAATPGYGSSLQALEKPPMANHIGTNNKANVMMNKTSVAGLSPMSPMGGGMSPAFPASPTSPNAPNNPFGPATNQQGPSTMQLRAPPPGKSQQQQSPSGRNGQLYPGGGPSSPLPASDDYSAAKANNNHSDIQMGAPSAASMISPPVPRLDPDRSAVPAYPDPAVLRQPATLQMSEHAQALNRGRSSSRQERGIGSRMGSNADFGGGQQLQQQQQQQPGFNFQKIMDDRFEHYKRPPSRERSSDRFGSRQQLMSRDPSRDRVNAGRPMSRQRTPMNNTTEIINNNSSENNGGMKMSSGLESLGLDAPRGNGGLAELRLPAEDALRYRGVQQEIPHFGAPPKRTESLYMKPGEQQEPQYKVKEYIIIIIIRVVRNLLITE